MAATTWLLGAALLAGAAHSLHADTESWQRLSVRYQRTAVGAGVSGFWQVPETYVAALQAGWVPAAAAAPAGLAVRAVASSAADLAFTPLYRTNLAGRLVGFGVAVPVADVYGSGPHAARPALPGGANEVVWLRNAYYIQSSALFAPPLELRSAAAEDAILFADLPPRPWLSDANGLWVRNTSEASGYTQLPTDLSRLVNTTRYTRQGCSPSLGTHYYYNMSEGGSEERCEEWSAWSVLGARGAAVGLGWQLFGAPVVYGRNWYDDVPSAHVPSHEAALAAAAPGACALHRAWAARYGLISIHVYFVPEPWTLHCDAEQR